MLCAEQSEGLGILADFASNLVIFYAWPRAKRGPGDFGGFSFEFGQFLCFWPSEARRCGFWAICIQSSWFFLLFAERSEARAIFGDFHSNFMICMPFAEQSQALAILADFRSNLVTFMLCAERSEAVGILSDFLQIS
jgi:hypothetical protein